MGIRTYTALALGIISTAAFAWQPLTYPIRSQSAYQRSIDTATCYAAANKTKVNITRESQIPPRPAPMAKTTSTGAPSRPPLPSSSFSAAPIGSPGMPNAASAPGASAALATSATPATTTTTAAVKGASAPSAAMAASAPAATSMTTADNAASDTAAASATQTTAGSNVKLPPLPAPEPPMTQYWAAYGACMQARGYVVTQ
ncbi:MAG TPA: hypothetical protein VFE79_04910 [Paraburkholderia sp.]|nr:hypothetical protein [Paraburkholderia sp.]